MIKRWSNQTPFDESFLQGLRPRQKPALCRRWERTWCLSGRQWKCTCGVCFKVVLSFIKRKQWQPGKETIPGTNEERWSMGLARYHQLEQRLCARRWVNSKWSVEREDVVRFMIQVDLLIIVQSLCFEFDLLMIGPSPLVAGHPTVFTEVAKYKDWIAQQYGMAIP